MGKKVFANGMEIAHKAGDAKVIAAFPDVCMSPPPPPAGPVPLPYPNTSMASDLQDGSKDVTIGGGPVALKDQSFYKTSPLGDEAATRNFGASLLTHGITGKTFFQAYSMNVMIEGKNVPRHLDLTTSNHSGQPGGTPPIPNAETMSTAGDEATEEPKCECCGGPLHGSATTRPAMTQSEFYNPPSPSVKPTKRQANAMAWCGAALDEAKATGCDDVVAHSDETAPCAKHYPASAADNHAARKEFEAMMSPLTPDEYFSEKYGAKLGSEVKARGAKLRAAKASGASSIAHKTPLTAGGCPVGEGNLAPVHDDCKFLEQTLGDHQGEIAQIHRRIHGIL